MKDSGRERGHKLQHRQINNIGRRRFTPC